MLLTNSKNSYRIYYSWTELLASTRIYSSMLIIMYAFVVGKGGKMAKSRYDLVNKLRLNDKNVNLPTPYVKIINNAIYSSCWCNEPQNYITNYTFLFDKIDEKIKCEYLYILSQRRLSDLNNYIPADMVDKKYWLNPYVIKEDDNLIFHLERETNNGW